MKEEDPFAPEADPYPEAVEVDVPPIRVSRRLVNGLLLFLPVVGGCAANRLICKTSAADHSRCSHKYCRYYGR